MRSPLKHCQSSQARMSLVSKWGPWCRMVLFLSLPSFSKFEGPRWRKTTAGVHEGLLQTMMTKIKENTKVDWFGAKQASSRPSSLQGKDHRVDESLIVCSPPMETSGQDYQQFVARHAPQNRCFCPSAGTLSGDTIELGEAIGSQHGMSKWLECGPKWLGQDVCGPRWLGQDVQFVGQDGWLSARVSVMRCQEGTRLGRPQQGGESPMEDMLCAVSRWLVLGCPAKAVQVAWERYVGEIGGESHHADLTLRADPAVSTQFEKNFQVP